MHNVRCFNESPPHELPFLGPSDKAKLWEDAVLVTNADYLLEATGQLYRDRADCENGFDELKNPWGWGGYTTQDLERCNLSARAVALIYNWWSGYVRLAHPKARLEAITSRPMLLSGIAPPDPARRSVASAAHAFPCGSRSDQDHDQQYPRGS